MDRNMEPKIEPSLEPERSEGDIPAAQEAAFINKKTLIISGIGLLAAIAVVHVAAFLILIPFLSGEQTAARAEASITPAGPPLQVNPPGDLARLRATQNANLNENAQIPIEQAMDMVLSQGVSVVPGGGAKEEETASQTGEPGEDLVQQGEVLFEEQGCSSCHTQADTPLAPTLVGIYGQQETLEGGETVLVDDEYLRQSIIDPHSQLVEGYSTVMPDTYGETLSEEDIAALVEYIKSLSGN